MDTQIEEHILKIFQSLFSKEQLRKNLYIFQYLNPDMTLRTKTIYQERKVAAISKDTAFVLHCLSKCPSVKLLDNDTLCILIEGDQLIVRIQSEDKKTQQIDIKKTITPLLKDIKHEIKQGSNDSSKVEIQIEFQSQTSVSQFIQRLKQKNFPISWQVKKKDPYDCIKKSVKFLLKQRKTQNQASYQTSQYNQSYNYGYYQNYDNQYYNQSKYQQYNTQNKYPLFIRKAQESDSEDELNKDGKVDKIFPERNNQEGIELNSNNTKGRYEKQGGKDKRFKEGKQQRFEQKIKKQQKANLNFGADDFPSL